MRSIILYGSPVKLTNAHKAINNHTRPPNGGEQQPEYFVRMKIFNGSLEQALHAARPMDGETLLNTVPAPESNGRKGKV